MNINNNTVLITGGSSGIGLATARLLSEKGNVVVIVGRNEQKLKSAVAGLQNIIPIKCDITNQDEVLRLVDIISEKYSGLNVLINNAGKAFAYLATDENANAFEKAKEEVATNYLAPVQLVELLLPILKAKEEAAIINISSIVSFAPGIGLPTYSATKAALHSFTQTLRFSLAKSTTVKVFEILPPLVDTEFSKELHGDKIPPSVVADELLIGLENDQYEIHVGATASLYKLFLRSPIDALKVLNRIN